MSQTEIENAAFSGNIDPNGALTMSQVVITERGLAVFDDAARDHVNSGRRKNTAAAYASDRRKWREYCAAFSVPEATLSVGMIVGFVEWLVTQQAAPKTIERRVSGARLSLRADGVADLSDADRSVVAERIRQYKRQLAETGERRGRGKAKAITVADLRKMSAALPNTLAGLRDRALLLIGFSMAARRSELAGLWTSDIEVCPDGLCITLRSSKTSDDDVDVAIPYGTSDLTCPVQAWVTYRTAVEEHLGRETEGKAFRRIDRHGRVLGDLSPQGVGIAFTRAAENAGIAAERVTAHGLRAGMATEARRAGHDVKTIARQGRWVPHGAAVHGYMQTVDQWDDNALKGIGL
ncbi:tyrosine-type recombinase/integrase [Saccharopolyspora shandongensis]|uniref:tyrosine-type recombinase/integrase n=1 Tax=Saccharopolyspora shandongensis TaxID=418495 RepID=UPI003406D8C9